MSRINRDAIIKAVETTDSCLQAVVDAGQELGYDFLIIADHGNAELNRLPDGSPHTAHTTNPVPVFYLGQDPASLSDGRLADVAPTLLSLLGVARPVEMTGKSLLTF